MDRAADGANELDVTWVRDADEALAIEHKDAFDAAIVSGDAAQALAMLRALQGRRRFPPVVVRLVGAGRERTRELLAAGATDVVLEPTLASESGSPDLLSRLEHVRKRTGVEAGKAVAPNPTGVVGRSPALTAVLALVSRAARSSATVLLTGETGTGKEVIARAVHETSPRSTRPFVAINCAAFPDTLLESELFGHAKGAFTGADGQKRGLFEEAHTGTLFLDEIAETSPPLQAKLLRVLQEREVRAVGSVRARRIDVRVVAASNRSLARDVKEGRFREDLYYRLAVFPVEVPPLRERTDDILPLAEHFLRLHGAREGKPGCRLSQASEHLLLSHTWPGNVRELENEVQRCLAMADAGDLITPDLLSPRLLAIAPPDEAQARPGETLRDSLGRIEAWLIRRALDRNNQRRAATARQLGITREGLYKKMQRLGIE